MSVVAVFHGGPRDGQRMAVSRPLDVLRFPKPPPELRAYTLDPEAAPEPIVPSYVEYARAWRWQNGPEVRVHYYAKGEGSRPSWDEYFLQLAEAVSQRATCSRSKVGAVLTVENRVIGTGYNGSPPGRAHCIDGACPRAQADPATIVPGKTSYESCIALHAEANALANATAPVRGATIYVTRAPCDWCSKTLEAFGVARVVTP